MSDTDVTTEESASEDESDDNYESEFDGLCEACEPRKCASVIVVQYMLMGKPAHMIRNVVKRYFREQGIDHPAYIEVVGNEAVWLSYR